MLAYVRGLVRDAADRDGEDVVQDVMLRLLEAPDPSRPIEDLAAYVYRALRNRVIDVIRGRRPEKPRRRQSSRRRTVPYRHAPGRQIRPRAGPRILRIKPGNIRRD